jgi:hypothetical protein
MEQPATVTTAAAQTGKSKRERLSRKRDFITLPPKVNFYIKLRLTWNEKSKNPFSETRKKGNFDLPLYINIKMKIFK